MPNEDNYDRLKAAGLCSDAGISQDQRDQFKDDLSHLTSSEVDQIITIANAVSGVNAALAVGPRVSNIFALRSKKATARRGGKKKTKSDK